MDIQDYVDDAYVTGGRFALAHISAMEGMGKRLKITEDLKNSILNTIDCIPDDTCPCEECTNIVKTTKEDIKIALGLVDYT